MTVDNLALLAKVWGFINSIHDEIGGFLYLSWRPDESLIVFSQHAYKPFNPELDICSAIVDVSNREISAFTHLTGEKPGEAVSSIMHVCRSQPLLSRTDAKSLDVGWSRAALALALHFEAPSFLPSVSVRF